MEAALLLASQAPAGAAVHLLNPLPNHARTARILHSSAFLARKKPLHLAGLLKALLRRHECWSAGEWVMGAADELARRSPSQVPVRWLEKLAAAYELAAGAPVVPSTVFADLPVGVWSEPALLGEVLQAARESLTAPRREGRAGRMSAGCVYTPSAVARPIVAEVHVGPRRVVDPACGPGVFLLEAFERAFRRRLEGGAAPKDAAIAALSHELVGIDIDAQALAVAEFSLRLAALRAAGLDDDVPLDLRLCDTLLPLPDLEGQCECVVGNPPFIEGRGLSVAKLAQLRRRFRCAAGGKINLFAVFVERGLELLKEGGVLAFVLPATFLRNARYRGLREVLLQHTLEAIRPLKAQSFGGRIVETVVLRVRKHPPLKTSCVQLEGGPTLQARLPLGPVLRFCEHLPRGLRRQIELMERHGVPLGECFEVRDGISTGFQPFPQRLIGRVEESRFVAGDGTVRPFDPRVHKKVIDGGEFHAFTPVRWAGRFIEYDKQHEHSPPHPGRPFNCQLRAPEIFDRSEKLLTRQTARGLIATVDRRRYFCRNSVHVSYPKLTLPVSPVGRDPGGEGNIPLSLGAKGVAQASCLPPASVPLSPVGRGARGEEAPSLSLDALCACLNARFYTDYLLAVTGESGNVFPQVHIADVKRLPVLPALLRADGEMARLGVELLAGLEAARLPLEAVEARKGRIEELLRVAFGLAG